MLPLLAQFSQFSADTVLSPYIYVFYISFLVAFLFTPIMRVVAVHYDIVDRPDRLRKMHSEPVAYLGGVAVFLGWLGGLAISQFLTLHAVPTGWPTSHLIIKFSIVIGACLILMLGLWDDIHGLRPVVKIGGQLLAALFLWAERVGHEAAKPIIAMLLPFLNKVIPSIPAGIAHDGSNFVLDWIVWLTSGIFVIVVVVGCCNATNLMDGLDGLCGGVTAIIAAGFLFVAVHLAMNGGGINTNSDALRIVLGLALLGAVLGFVPYNFNPASIFMGDTGSMFLGFSCAVMIILMAQERPKWFLATLVMFALPVLDTALAFIRRWVNGRPLFSADKQHFHHQLVSRGFSVKQTVLIAYGLAIMFALLGGVMVYVRTRYAVAVYLVVFGSIIVAAYKAGMVHEKVRVVTRTPLGDGEAIAPTDMPAIDAGTVLEVKDDDPRTQPVQRTMPGSWNDQN
ncbi:MAG TPA: MraY family glycosyltransferase [Tepidisphaeraceae bacterium]|jgi:UDP-GlcNAc:undecaprenyl-phosphate GlcNAc-1-phosphate transferase|nr:MraY family glycosyltransferase [Tepidisphaeraceae bacterium]